MGRGAQARRGGVGPALLALGAAGLLAGLGVLGITLASDHVDHPVPDALMALLVGWSFIGTGLFAWWRRPANRTGLLMTATGFAWFASELSASDDDLLFTIGILLDGLFVAVVGHLLIAFPTGVLATRAERVLAGVGYFAVTVLQVPSLLFEVPGDPRNLLIVEPNQGLSDALDAVQYVVAVALVLASLVILSRRPRRPALVPVLWTGGVAFVLFGIAKGFDAAGSPSEVLDWLSEAGLAAVPFAFLTGLLRSRLAQGAAVSALIARVGELPGEEGPLRAALAEALDDPTLALAYWLPESERFVDALGHPVKVGGPGWTEVEVGGRRIAAIAHDPELSDEPQLVRAAGAAAALALENQRLSAELRARIEDLRASRARIVSAGDEERRRLERDLHDGAQSRLVALALKLRLARMKVEPESEAAALLDESSGELQASLNELRELARGIHPAILTDKGLEPALRALADRAPVPVDVSVDAGELPPAVETAVYFVVSEALANVAKYAEASSATVTVSPGVVVEVRDDGVGGADLGNGSGLRGLADRVGALDGRISLHSPSGEGTTLRADIPC